MTLVLVQSSSVWSAGYHPGDETTGVISLQNNLPREIHLAFRLEI